MENLYYMLNFYLRTGSTQAFDTFKEINFCLKASMCKEGNPITQLGVVYRGLGLKAEFLRMYVENKGKCILLNGFTSTTVDKNEAIKFTLMAPHGLKTLFEIQIVDFDESFAKFINDFGFPEENGVFFPVDINQYSCYPQEKEVLFPPFYPIRIINVQHMEGYYKIIAHSPSCVNAAGKDFLSNTRKVFYEKRAGKNVTLKIF